MIKAPMVLGHEVIGKVIHSDSSELHEGQTVAINPSKPCGHCKYCIEHNENQCKMCIRDRFVTNTRTKMPISFQHQLLNYLAANENTCLLYTSRCV